MSRTLDARRSAEVIRLCREARVRAARGDRAGALEAFLDAWELLPEPKESWDAAAFVLAGVGDLLRGGGDPLGGGRAGRAHASA